MLAKPAAKIYLLLGEQGLRMAQGSDVLYWLEPWLVADHHDKAAQGAFAEGHPCPQAYLWGYVIWDRVAKGLVAAGGIDCHLGIFHSTGVAVLLSLIRAALADRGRR